MKTFRKKWLLTLVIIVSMNACLIMAQSPVVIPDIPGYQTLQCDFHIHSIFSDGKVWPTVRVDEAHREGLDVISLTEHLSPSPHRNFLVPGHNHSYEITAPYAKERDILLIRGSEITRPMAPGHSNAIFLSDSEPLDTENWRDAFVEAKKQNAFIFWNHPSWERQQPDETRWFPEHTDLYENGMLHGIEVVNGTGYSPEAHQWCIDKNLTMIGTSDSHAPVMPDLMNPGKHRTMTLVFARERTPEAVREALDARRTLVYFDDVLIGDKKLLRSLYESALEIEDIERESRRVTIRFKNKSGLTFRLKKTAHEPGIDYLRTGERVIAPHSNGTFVVRFPEGKHGDVNFEITNLWSAPGKGLEVSYSL